MSIFDDMRGIGRTHVQNGYVHSGLKVLRAIDALEKRDAKLCAALREIQKIGETELVHSHPQYGSAPHKVALIAAKALEDES